MPSRWRQVGRKGRKAQTGNNVVFDDLFVFCGEKKWHVNGSASRDVSLTSCCGSQSCVAEYTPCPTYHTDAGVRQ